MYRKLNKKFSQSINQASTSELNQDIAATRALLDSLICTRAHSKDCTHVLRLPISQHKLEMSTYASRGFSNLTAAAPLNEENERSLVLSLIHDLNERSMQQGSVSTL